jgi:hypothetical protein
VSATTATAVSATFSTWRTPGMEETLAASKEATLAAEDRALLRHGDQHAGHLEVGAVDQRAGGLGGGVEALHRGDR